MMIGIDIFSIIKLHMNFQDFKLEYFAFPLPTIIEGLK